MGNSYEKYMKMALELAVKANGRQLPNPMCGAVVVRGGRVVGRGYHRKAGAPHAEIIALNEAGERAKGALLIVTLEPCSHFGRTPPCTEEIIKRGIKEVAAAMKDPNPVNNGRGIRQLRRAGIKVQVGILKKEAQRINEFWIKFITAGMPFVTVKVAQTLDGKIASCTGESKWISSLASRTLVHRLRDRVDAVMVGVNTVLKDDPLLTARIKNHSSLKRVIADTSLKTPLNARLFSVKESPVIIAVTKRASLKRIAAFEKKGAEIIIIREKEGRVDLRDLMRRLAKEKITNLLIEGGGEIIGSAFEARIVDKVYFFIAPKIIGGSSARTSVEGRGIAKIADAVKLKNIKIQRIGKDVLVEGYVYRNY